MSPNCIRETNGRACWREKEAAVTYFSWDTDQRISYDDAESFKQKIEWANSIGFSGSLIWASNLDDYENSAHIAFTRNKNFGSIGSFERINKVREYTETANSFFSEGCGFIKEIIKDMMSYNDDEDMKLVGYDTHGCKKTKSMRMANVLPYVAVTGVLPPRKIMQTVPMNFQAVHDAWNSLYAVGVRVFVSDVKGFGTLDQ
ncbi:glycoside hydrolase family 18 protein [Amniculicola lignicola CBS 123094]|uniref:Glycoside hydrolase family 18 protein n=1 Tax=Amniculicola lignicola CBS 123094 TaxID=1392246 RepID=A0A6A5WH71_9PLEO|nr:glycoside hydrolase family 18 protein [Amniculicola lignicola CBS 123094]